MTQDELVNMLAAIKAKQAEYAPIMDTLKADMDLYKSYLLPMLEENGTERIRSHGIVVSRATRTTPGILNLHDAMNWLEEKNMLGEFMTLDVKRLWEKYPECPGIYITESSYLSIREDSKGGDNLSLPHRRDDRD